MSIPSLDDEELVKELDSKDMLGITAQYPEQWEEAIQRAKKTPNLCDASEVEHVIICGMGGSGASGDLARVILEAEMEVPIIVSKGYHLPKFVSNRTLVFVVSHSGTTEETLSCFEQALEKKSKIVIITSGRELATRAFSLNIPVIEIPGHLQARASIGFLFMPLIVTLMQLGMISNRPDELSEVLQVLRDMAKKLAFPQPTCKNPAKQLAIDLYGKIPIIYGSEGITGIAALRWKCEFNESSKIPAFWNILPELDHNEIVGWQLADRFDVEFALVNLREPCDYSRNIRRMNITTSLIGNKFKISREIWAEGTSRFARLASLIHMGDFTARYLALLYGVDPTPVDIIWHLKARLGEGE